MMYEPYIKCDALDCDYEFLTDGYDQKHVGMPCPKCGENLMTQNDFDDFIKYVVPVFEELNKLGVIKNSSDGDKENNLDAKKNMVKFNIHDGVFSASYAVKT